MSKVIILSSKKYPNLKCIVDNEDYEILIQYTWNPIVSKYNDVIYTIAWINHKHVYMHRFIMQLHGNDIKNKMIDHEDHNGLNNQKENLRVCSNTDNQHNSNKKKNAKTSKYKGVSYHIKDKKYRARIMLNTKGIFIGNYDTEKEAALAYNEKAIELFREFACLNIII